MDEDVPVVEVSRGLKEVIVWRYIAEMVRRYPDRFWVYQAEKESWDEGSKPHMLRIVLAYPEHDGRFGEFDLLEGDTYRFRVDGDIGEMPGPWRMAVEFEELKGVLNHLTGDIFLYDYQHGQMSPTTPATLVYRVIAGVAAATAFNYHSWRWANAVRLDENWLHPALRTDLLRSFPALDIPEPRYADIGNARNDPAYRYWILTRDREPLVCLAVDGFAHFSDGREIELMRLYDATRKGGLPGRIAPVVHTIGANFLP